MASKRLAVLYSARDLLPGRYTFAIRPVGAGGDALAAGRYRIVVRATGTDGDEASHVAAAPRAMTAVALYWAQGCHLCEPAKETARAVCAELGVSLEEIDITGDETLEAAVPRRRCRCSRSTVAARSSSTSTSTTCASAWPARWRADGALGRRTISLVLCAADALRYRRVYAALCCYEIVGITGAKPRGIRATDSRRRCPAVPLSAGTDPDEEDGSRRDLLAGDRGVHAHQRHPDPA